MSTLRIKDLHVSVETAEGPTEILKGVNLTINSGESHAIMSLQRQMFFSPVLQASSR